MTRLSWNLPGERLYFAGVDRGVLYPKVGPGVVWTGLISVEETPSDINAEIQYIDGQKYVRYQNPDSFSGTLEAFTYPEEFLPSSGHSEMGYTSQDRIPFNFSYRTFVSSDENPRLGYLIHLIYNALALPNTHENNTVNSDVHTENFKWDIVTNPILIPGSKAVAHMIIDSRIIYPWALEELENNLYGTASTPPTLPSPIEVIDLFERNAILRVTDHGDGTFTVDGPSEAIQMVNSTTYTIAWPSVIMLDGELYQISSL